MADTPNDALEVKHSEPPLRATRRRLLQGMGSSIALSLAGCGYGFVAPRTSAADPFTIQMGNQEQLILQFCDRLFSDGALQKSFIADPIRTMRANGAIPELSNVAIDRVNVLLLYMIGNQSLLYKLQAIAEKHSAASNTLNSFTLANVNVDVAEKAQNAFHTDADVQAMLGEQIEVLVSDEKFRQILGLNVSEAGLGEYSKQLTGIMISDAQMERRRPAYLLGYVNVAGAANAIAIANGLVLSNVVGIANALVYANAIYSTNIVVSGPSGSGCPPPGDYSLIRSQRARMATTPCSELHSFAAQLAARAQEIQAGG